MTEVVTVLVIAVAASTETPTAAVSARLPAAAVSQVAASLARRADSLRARSIAVRALRAYLRVVDLTNVQGYLHDRSNTRIFVASQQLANSLDTAAALSPFDNHIAAVRVYNHVMALRYKEAEQAALECNGGSWWCAAALGFALHGGDRYGESERAYERALTLMPRDQRCLWDDISQILNDSEFVAHYRMFSCDERSDLNSRIWWLSSPLWMNMGNDRRTEHYSRWFSAEMLRLQSELMGWRRVRTDLITDDVASIIRMGELHWYGGLNVGCDTQFIARLYCEPWQKGYAFEDRHIIRYRAVESPYSAGVFDLTLEPLASGVAYSENADTRAPGGTRSPRFASSDSGYRRMKGEAYGPAYGYVNVLRDAQTAFLLRRGRTAALLTSFVAGDGARMLRTDPPTEWAFGGATLRRGILSAAVTVSPAPGVMDIATAEHIPPAPVRMMVTTNHDSAIISLEAKSKNVPVNPAPPTSPRRLADYPAAVRRRFAVFRPDIGITSRLKSSDVVFYDAAPGTQPKSADAVLALMLPRSTVARDLPLGLYWETYGLRAGEAPEFELTVTPVDSTAGIIGTVARAVGLAERPGSVLTSWRAPPVDAQSIGANNETAHTVVITLTTLREGTYRLALTTRDGDDTTRVSKLIRVR